jgi:hypothetical protein
MSGTAAVAGLDGLLGTADAAGVPELRAQLAELLGGATGEAQLVDARMIWRSRVYRVRFQTGGALRSLVLKRLPPDRAHREQLVLRRWLPHVGLEAHGSPLRGVAAARGGECVWHVYDDLGGSTLDTPAPDREHVRAAVELVARVHTSFAASGLLGECRQFGVDLGLRFLAAGVADAIRALEAIRRRHADLDGAPRHLLERLLERLHGLRAAAPERTRLLAACGGPETLLHGDLWTSNIFVLPGAQGAHVRLIDWDHAGVGHASYDLSALLLRFPARERAWILESYAASVAAQGLRLPDRGTLNVLFETAETARLVNCVLWPAIAYLDTRAGWAEERLAEVEKWFDMLQPVLPDS